MCSHANSCFVIFAVHRNFLLLLFTYIQVTSGEFSICQMNKCRKNSTRDFQLMTKDFQQKPTIQLPYMFQENMQHIWHVNDQLFFLTNTLMIRINIQVHEFPPTVDCFELIYQSISLVFPLSNLAYKLSSSSYWLVVVFQIKDRKNIVHPETAFVVKLHNVARLAPSQQVIQFAMLAFPSICPLF